MKPLLGYFFLAIGIFFGIVANSLAKISDGFSKLGVKLLGFLEDLFRVIPIKSLLISCIFLFFFFFFFFFFSGSLSM